MSLRVRNGEHSNLSKARTDKPIGVLHTIFFHRFFTPLRPATHDVLDLTLPYVSEDDIEDLIEQRTIDFLRQLESATTTQYSQAQPKACRLVVQFSEKKRKKSWFATKTDEETVWENWVLEFTLTSARSEPESTRNRRLMEKQLHAAAMQIVKTVNVERNHIPPITTNESNPFPFQILVNPKGEAWRQKTGIF